MMNEQGEQHISRHQNVPKQIPEEEGETFNTNIIFLPAKVLGSWKLTITLPVPCSDGHHQL